MQPVKHPVAGSIEASAASDRKERRKGSSPSNLVGSVPPADPGVSPGEARRGRQAKTASSPPSKPVSSDSCYNEHSLRHIEGMERDDSQREIELALAGDRAAADHLVRALTPVIQRSVAYGLLLWHHGAAASRNIPQEVADLTQEILLHLFVDDGKVLRRWKPERGLSLERFVGFVARRQTLAFLRNGKRSPWKEIPTPPEDLDQVDRESSPEAAASSRQQLEHLLAQLKEELSPLGWHLFDLLYLRELSVDEVVEQTDLSSDAVYKWRSRLSHRVRRWRAEMSETVAAAQSIGMDIPV